MTPTAPISVSGGDVLGTGLNLPLFLAYLATSVVSACVRTSCFLCDCTEKVLHRTA